MIFMIPILAGGLLWWWFSHEPAYIKKYERNFLEMHGPDPTFVLESEFHNRDPMLPAKLCQYDIKKKKVLEKDSEGPPNIETHLIGLKTIEQEPVPAQFIRCKNRIGIIQAPGRNCAYLLHRGISPRSPFYIRQKFCYKEVNLLNKKRSLFNIWKR